MIKNHALKTKPAIDQGTIGSRDCECQAEKYGLTKLCFKTDGD